MKCMPTYFTTLYYQGYIFVKYKVHVPSLAVKLTRTPVIECCMDKLDPSTKPNKICVWERLDYVLKIY
jgi:hypothetical protein